VLNNTDTTFYLTPDGTVHEGDDPPPPDGSTMLVAPGSQIQDDLAKKHGIFAKLGGASAVKVARDSAGEPLVTLPSGRAMAARILPDGDARKAEAMEAAGAEDEAEARARSHGEKADAAFDADDEPEPGPKVKAESKAVHRDSVEDKAVKAPRRR
jgi:hypothetical protein